MKANLPPLLPPLHTLVEGRVGERRFLFRRRFMGEEVPFSLEVHEEEASPRRIPHFMSQPPHVLPLESNDAVPIRNILKSMVRIPRKGTVRPKKKNTWDRMTG
jgi:hypothetical protein